MGIEANKFLTVAQGVILTKSITPVIIALEPYFVKANVHAIVTSGLRDAEKQLQVIREYLHLKGLDHTYPDTMACKATDQELGVFKWQMAWSNLLHVGVIINPPIAAKCLMDSFRPNGTNRKGTIINQTPHARGTAFNIGGIVAVPVLDQALKDKVHGFIDYLTERENNATHCDCALVP